MLMLRFMDVSTKLEPFFYSTEQGIRGVYAMPDYQEVTKDQQKQHVCGKIFTEFWSSHSEGFPMPVGCYYSQKLSDLPTTGGSIFFREIYITFGERNGLRENTEYHIVLNAEIQFFNMGDQLVDIYAMCAGFTGCSRPYQVFEKGTATASRSTEIGATAAEPQFSLTDGFLIQRGDPLDGVLNLSNLNILQIQLKGQSGVRAIVKESFIRMYMWPLTAWDVGTASCVAECVPYYAAPPECNGLVGCDSEEVVVGSGRRNIVKITLPTEMSSIDETTTHTIKAGLIMKVPEPGATTGRLVISDRSGYGPLPFKGDASNVLYFRIQLGATLWNVGRNNAASLTINLPTGYGACSIVGSGQPPTDLNVFLQTTGGYIDNNRGVLAVSNDDGDWANSNLMTCQYELFANNQAIYAGMVFYVAATVINPTNALPKTDPDNVLTIKLSSLGHYDPEGITDPAPKDMPDVAFISLAEEKTLGQDLWAGNPAVINMLTEELVQPSSFVRSCCGPNFDTRREEDFLRIFFRTSTYVGQNGFVVFDSPSGFDFGPNCTARDLPERYYAFVGMFEFQLFRLKNMGSCQGRRYPSTEGTYNRAVLQVGGIIDAPFYYGYELRALHPTTYDTTQHENWYLWLQDSNGYPLEGSQSTIKFNKFQDAAQTSFYHKSWGMYNEIGQNIPVQVLSLRPTSMTNANTQVIFYPIQFPIALDTSLRISAPVGFKWDPDPNNFFRRSNGTIADWPGIPEVQNNNQLVWQSISLAGNTVYGFQATVEVPNFNPVMSANAFFIEFGFRNSNIQQRLFANVVEAPSIAALTNAEVYSSTNLVNYGDNRIEFAVQTVTTLTPNTGIVVKGSDATTGFTFVCPDTVVALPESDPFPTDLICVYQLAPDGSPQITLKVNDINMPPGYYRWEMVATNPPTRKQDPGTWTFGTYLAVSNYPSTDTLDKELAAEGFRIDNMMREARMTALDQTQRAATNRNDRPGKLNQLVFQFSLNIRPLATGILALRGPRGFEFDDNCLPYVITDRNDVFGPNTQDVWPPDYSEWPPEYRPTKCAGNGREALITVPSGLGRNSLYVFRIGVRKNPMSTPEWNKWSINFNEQASDPFQGFTVWTFTNMNIMAVGAMKTPTGAGIIRTPTPVTIEFMPYNTVPPKPPNEQFGGMLRLTVPVGYEIQHSNSQCEVELFVTDGSVVFEDSDYSCRVENTVKQLLYMAGAKDIRGSYPYTLIVWTFNPPTAAVAETWRIDTFHTWTAEPDTALDETEFLGYNVNNQLNIFQVTNSLNVFNGNTKVNDIDILLNFPDPMKDDDEILIVGPRGFNLIGNPQLANCNESAAQMSVTALTWFRWVDGVQLPATGEPGCTCDPQGFCTIRWQIDESRDPAYPQNEDIHFKVATTNPSQTPFLTDNYWKASHVKAAVVKSSHIYRGWDINPQLENVDIALVGNDYAAGKTSDIEVTFTPITDADTIYIEAIFPTQFSFDQSTVALPYDIDGQSEGATLIINRGAFRAGITATIRINTVRLGRAGGQTRFNLITYRDETRTEKRDEKLDFDGGFRLPGLITVQGTPVLKSQYQVAAAANPVKQLFRPRVLEDAQAEFTLSFTRPVQASERLLITCQGQAQYQLKQSPFVVIGIGQIENQVEIDSFGTLRATLKPGRPATEVALQADTPYTIIMWVLPIQGANTWRFDTSDGGSLPTNTNDGDLDGFYPVEQMVLGVEAVRSPPKAVVDVILNIDAGSAIVRELIIIAPPSFLFDESAGGCGNMCLPGEALSSTSRRTATIQSPTGEPLTQLRNLKVRVLTPAQTPSSVTWYVEGRGQGAGTTVGWGEGLASSVCRRRIQERWYPAVATIAQAQIVFTFALNINAGNQINIEAPPGFILTCSTEGALKQISLPGGKPDCIDDPLQIRLGTTLTADQYAFSLLVDLPPDEPRDNTFSVIVRDQDGGVVDAAYSIQGKPFVIMGVTDPYLDWSQAEPGQRTQITIGLTFTGTTPNVKAVLIMLPERFIHDVQTPTDVQNINKQFPVAAGSDWADTQYTDRIKIYLDDTGGGQAIDPGEYRFSFPALVPPSMSNNNYWSISLCFDRDCQQPDGQYIIVSFPIAGFQLYELSQETLRVTTNFAPRRARLSGEVFIPLFAFMLLLLRPLYRDYK
ncbi:unnamed protein product [Symbiodinium sp. KB8]|nr:unnamed protein product [Symbiodinium sp. KB8]